MPILRSSGIPLTNVPSSHFGEGDPQPRIGAPSSAFT